MTWELVFSKQAQKDAKKLTSSSLRPQAEALLEILRNDPYQSPSKFERLIGDLGGSFSRRINIQHRLIYQVFDEDHVVRILRMWSHYE